MSGVDLAMEDVEMAAADDSSSSSTSSEPEDTTGDGVTLSLPPNHITADGVFVNLPSPTDAERMHFFERSITRHGLLEDDLNPRARQGEEEEEEVLATTGDAAKAGKDADVKEGDEKKKESSTTEPTIHPLALASARLESHGINELNRAINLQTLAAPGSEYFGLTNIVDPAMEISTTTAQPTDSTATENQQAPGSTATKTAAAATAPELDLEEPRTRARYVLKRKRAQFEKAAATLKRHRLRLEAAVVAQARPDRRLRELRPQWRLVAPEHGKRALPHAARPTEVVAADVDVYFSRRNDDTASSGNTVSGHLASRVPGYATIELKEDYNVEDDLKQWRQVHASDLAISKSDDDVDSTTEAMDTEETKTTKEEAKGQDDVDKPTSTIDPVCTQAVPFAIANPALGKLDADFDPKKIAMLTLQFDIEKPSTGFCQSACLEPIVSSSSDESPPPPPQKSDENLLMALQHSLFCAKLFESIRRELAPDTEGIGHVRTSAKAQSAVWLSGEPEQNFLPPPSLMMGGDVEGQDGDGGLPPLCVVYTHEGDLKVLLDCEYSLRVRLVEARPIVASKTSEDKVEDAATSSKVSCDSGSQSPQQLLFLCRALLLHAQETYHQHNVKVERSVLHHQEQEANENKENPHIKAKEYSQQNARILQSCVSLGAKMLFERRIRKTLRKVNDWIKMQVSGEERLGIEWLSLSVFDQSAQFNVSFRSWSIDANIAAGDELTVMRFGESGEYRKVKFHSDDEFELYLKMALKRVLRSIK